MWQAPIAASERKTIMAARGTMNLKDAEYKFGRNAETIRKIWKSDGQYVAFTVPRDHGLSGRQAIVVDLLRAAGPAGLLLADLSDVLKQKGYCATQDSHRSIFTHANYKLKGQGSEERIRRISALNEPLRYALLKTAMVRAPEPDAEWVPSIPSMPSRVKTESGAWINVARVSFLDGHA
jgi:hypothetical protein